MRDKNDLAEDRTDWAEERTEWAEDRTILANERTFAGWLRTGMAAIAIAVGLRAIFGEQGMPYGPARAAATLFILVAIFIFWKAWRKATKTRKRLDSHASSPVEGNSFGILALAFSTGAVGVGVLLWLI